MGHALRQISSALIRGGILIDLRPLSASCPLEIVTPESALEIAVVDWRGMERDDAAADGAVGQALEEGLLERLGRIDLDLDFLWDGFDELSDSLGDSQRFRSIEPPVEALERTHGRLFTGAEGGARIRCSRPFMLATYETHGSGGAGRRGRSGPMPRCMD